MSADVPARGEPETAETRRDGRDLFSGSSRVGNHFDWRGGLIASYACLMVFSTIAMLCTITQGDRQAWICLLGWIGGCSGGYCLWSARRKCPASYKVSVAPIEDESC